MSCLKDYIGILKDGAAAPLSGIYINQLPGISLEGLTKVADAEKQNAEGLWRDVQARAWVRLEKDFRIAMRARFRLSAIKSFATAAPELDGGPIAAAAKYRGLVIDLGQLAPHAGVSAHTRASGTFLSIHVDRVAVRLSEACESLVVKIFDPAGQVLDTFTKANAEAGLVVLPVSKKYTVQRVFIAVDAEAVPLYQGTLPQLVLDGCHEAVCSFCPDCEPRIYGAEADKASPADAAKQAFFYGLEVTYGAMCDFSTIICSNREEFTDVWMYLLGAELMLERLHSSRLNKFTTIDRESATELRDHYTVHYEKCLRETVAALEINHEDCCLECSPVLSQRVSLP